MSNLIPARVESLGVENLSIDSLPLELLYQILLPVSYNDIVSYCRTSVRSKIICNDTRFWMQKLDQDYAHLSDDHMKPSDYVRLYGDTEGIDIYKRWEVTYKNVENMVKYGYNDNIMWMSNMMGDGPEYFINHATRYGNMEILRWAYECGIYPDIMALKRCSR